MEKRVVITGMGIISALGIGKEAFWEALVEGRSGLGPITGAFDASPFRINLACEVKDFKPGDYLNDKDVSFYGRQAQFALAAARMSIEDSSLAVSDMDVPRTGVVMGNLFGEAQLVEDSLKKRAGEELTEDDLKSLYSYPYMGASHSISSFFGFSGISETLFGTCSSGNMAIARACELIKMDICDIVLAGGVEVISQSNFMNFLDLKLLDPEKCRPFDKNRKGTVVGEGAGILVLQSLDRAKKAGLPIYAEVLGYGMSCDAYHPSSPDPRGDGISRSMGMALEKAGVEPSDIEYVNAHGTGTKMNDKVETIALKSIFGSHSGDLLISATKSMMGHAMGAASAIEAAICCLVLSRHIIPPTINYHDPDPECDLNFVPNNALKKAVKCCMNNSIGFGGINASLILAGV